jgi:hypothetical protein
MRQSLWISSGIVWTENGDEYLTQELFPYITPISRYDVLNAQV